MRNRNAEIQTLQNSNLWSTEIGNIAADLCNGFMYLVFNPKTTSSK